MRALTYQQLFEGRILLCGALRHIAQQHAHYELMRSSLIFHSDELMRSSLTFHSASGAEAFGIVHRRLRSLEAEFERKKAPRAA